MRFSRTRLSDVLHTQACTAGRGQSKFALTLNIQFVQILRTRLKAQEIDGSWHTLRQWISGRVRVTAVFQRPDGHALHVRKATQPKGKHPEICRALGIDTLPRGIEKLIY